ncbi:MAG: protein kinase [Myxococcota bacterium]
MTMLAPGSVFAGEYRVIRRLGAGGMGAVYEAEQQSTRKRRALKVLSNRFGVDEKAQARFVREATVGADIDSAHVVDVIGAGIDAPTGLPWLAMELLDGADLKRLHEVRGRLEPGHLGAVFEQLGHGLAAAHAAGVVHRDLKPENIFVARSRRAGGSFTVKILDFGIAKVAREAVVSTDTATIGSPMWMAPEQINAEPLSVRTDVWALGLLAFWALTGRVYWKAAYGQRVTVQALFAEQLFADLVPPTVRAQDYEVGTRVPAGFDAWFAQCVTRDPGERFADAGAAMTALHAVLAPWLAAAGPTLDALLPEPGAPPPDSRVSSGPALSPGASPGISDLAHMAGTTADMMAAQSLQPTLHGTSAPSVSALAITNASADQGPRSTGIPVVEEEAPATPSRRPWLAAAVALPLVAGGGAAAWLALQPDEPSTVQARAPVEDDPPAAESRLDVGAPTVEPTAEPAPEPAPTGHVDLASLPAPSSVRFLGWTPDGAHAALRVGYGSKVATRGVANFLELILVLDGRSGSVEASYVVDRVARASVGSDDPLARAAASSFPAEQWLQRRVELLLRRPEPRRVPARRRGELTFALDDIPQSSRVRVQAKRAGFDVSWWGFDGLRGEHDTPTLRLTWQADEQRAVVLQDRITQEVPFLRELALRSRDPVTFSGHVRPYWSAAEDKAVVVVDLSAGTAEDALVDRRWFIVDVPDAPDPSLQARPRIRG